MNKIAAFLIALATGAGLLMTAPAQAQPVAGKDYQVLQPAQPVPAGKIEVTEFFGYWCPHCNHFENTWEAWSAKQGKDVVIKHVPVAFNNDARLVPYSRIYYALEAMGKLQAKSSKGMSMHARVFDAIHGADRLNIRGAKDEQDKTVSDFAAKEGLDRKAFMDAYNSFSVSSNVSRANQLTEQYRIQGVPTVVVQGKYVVSPDEAGGYVKTVQTLDYLVQQIRAGKM
ncbi:thiol:disulfide interchange protein DsbA/DsbL [Ralstonia mannitolilytica]|uniref:thiol:disulfide interchange protein DsbA/DsbL n=1 Tax=Ralstonia mannitolilytica TaxID=105219 RepID=UPI0028F517EB|nr:thiol:disulfide interchange protein DsbA/DsbL [Ralstonia mannitolilytica]CAJ0738471.1 Thiol:disulfide interchange protein DsbA [Ralstonia mannitolilytica]